MLFFRGYHCGLNVAELIENKVTESSNLKVLAQNFYVLSDEMELGYGIKHSYA